MAPKAKMNSSCPFHWEQHHPCIRDGSTRDCRECKSYVAKQPVDYRDPSNFSPTMFDAGAHFEIFKEAHQGSLSTLDILPNSLNSNVFTIKILKALDDKIEESKMYTFNFGMGFDGYFRSINMMFARGLDRLVGENLTASLRGTDEYSETISNATLAGGYSHFLCSTIGTIEEETVTTVLDGHAVDNEYTEFNLLLHIRYIAFCRLKTLVKDILLSIRYQPPDVGDAGVALNTYAAGVILRYELGFFQRNLRNGKLADYNHLPGNFRQILIKWLESVVNELTDYIRRGCGKYAKWQTAITGSKRDSRRSGETLKLALSLHQTKYTVSKPLPQDSKYTDIGDGNKFLLPESSARAEIDPVAVHVSGPLSTTRDTWEDTSDLPLGDLFPNFQTYYHTLL